MKDPLRALVVQGYQKTVFFFSPNQNEKENSCGTKGWIELKQCSKFEFVHGLNVYKKWNINSNHQRILAADLHKTFLCLGTKIFAWIVPAKKIVTKALIKLKLKLNLNI